MPYYVSLEVAVYIKILIVVYGTWGLLYLINTFTRFKPTDWIIGHIKRIWQLFLQQVEDDY
jgi:hypothetical protein